jgi:hypothetical protein
MDFTERLVNLGRSFIKELKPNDIICAFIGGSVGRGEADEFSDLDLNYYVLEPNIESSSNVSFGDQIIQLHVHSLPDIKLVYQNPWEFRFLLEARSIHDPDQVLEDLKTQATLFIDSSEGRTLMSSQAKRIVMDRISWMDTCIEKREWISAGIAARSSVIDAAFYYSYFAKNSIAASHLMDNVRGLPQYNELKASVFISPIEVDKLLISIHEYRTYLRNRFGSNYALDAVQDELCRRKSKRHLLKQDLDNIFWQISSEALWSFLSISQGASFNKHFLESPQHIQIILKDLGYIPYSIEQLENMRTIAEGIIKEAEEVV